MIDQLACPEDRRRSRLRAVARAGGTTNGIDYLEVLDKDAPAGSPPQQTLLIHCFLPVVGLDQHNAQILGGVRVTSIGIAWAAPANAVPSGLLNPAESAFLTTLSDRNNVFVVRTTSTGDFSTYTLRLILSPSQSGLPPANFDPVLSSIDFSFKVDCFSDFDCRAAAICSPVQVATPQIDYLAKDFASFNRLMLDRLSVVMPGWQERNPADLDIALVEILAYAADYLSYYQDAVATEAYLGTARKRVSVRRHARLVDYFLSDGANARAWVHIAVKPGGGADGATLPVGSQILSHDASPESTIDPNRLADALAHGALVFETLQPTTLKSQRNEIAFHTWGDPRCCLPKGATQATLKGKNSDLALHAGDLLIFEEVLGSSGLAVDADPAHRHVVRLEQDPIEWTDPLTNEAVLSVTWWADDALPYPLCLWEFPDGPNQVKGASVAYGNICLVDHGLTISAEPLEPNQVPNGGAYRPRLRQPGLTQHQPYDDGVARGQPAVAATTVDLTQVVPDVTLNGDGETWFARRDLLASDRFASEFVVELETDGVAWIRFGDDVLGRQPVAGSYFTATYRVGNGPAGNVGADALTCLVSNLTDIVEVRNPLAATGGTDPEPITQAQLLAPQAFRTQERAVTEADYAEVAQRHPKVQRAAATRRWTGSWNTMFVTVDRLGGAPVDDAFKVEMRAFLERFRLAGYDLEIDSPRYVPLDIGLTICVAVGYVRANVEQALHDVFSAVDLADGRRGFFHPDNFTFGQPVYLSRIIAAAMQVPGVAWVDADNTPPKPNRFQRWGQVAQGEIEAGVISLDRLEIARLDNDPNRPEDGRIEFFMMGGQ
ncbi:MAG TPA: putative baseplate assembly protein [Chloroflexota bacterium]|nr:putative baseplate assembly protein [Chloroflexota bacterium]